MKRIGRNTLPTVPSRLIRFSTSPRCRPPAPSRSDHAPAPSSRPCLQFPIRGLCLRLPAPGHRSQELARIPKCETDTNLPQPEPATAANTRTDPCPVEVLARREVAGRHAPQSFRATSRDDFSKRPLSRRPEPWNRPHRQTTITGSAKAAVPGHAQADATIPDHNQHRYSIHCPAVAASGLHSRQRCTPVNVAPPAHVLAGTTIRATSQSAPR